MEKKVETSSLEKTLLEIVPGVGVIAHSLNLLNLPDSYNLKLEQAIYTAGLASWQALSCVYLISKAFQYFAK